MKGFKNLYVNFFYKKKKRNDKYLLNYVFSRHVRIFYNK